MLEKYIGQIYKDSQVERLYLCQGTYRPRFPSGSSQATEKESAILPTRGLQCTTCSVRLCPWSWSPSLLVLTLNRSQKEAREFGGMKKEPEIQVFRLPCLKLSLSRQFGVWVITLNWNLWFWIEAFWWTWTLKNYLRVNRKAMNLSKFHSKARKGPAHRVV